MAVNKNGRIADYGEWAEGRWVWMVNLTRQLFDLEITQWDEFEGLLKEFQLSRDEIVWKNEATGQCTAKSFCRDVLNDNDNANGLWKKVCVNLASSRVESFV